MAETKLQAEQLIKELFSSLGIGEEFEINESEDMIDVIINSDDPGILIGHLS